MVLGHNNQLRTSLFHFLVAFTHICLVQTPPKSTNSTEKPPLKHLKRAKLIVLPSSWDDWVPQDRLRKLTDDNRELAANLRRELAAATAPKVAPKSIGKTRRGGQGSELGSGRGSEERTSSVPAAGGRGSKRARDNDIEKVGGPIPQSEPPKSIPLSRANLLRHTPCE